MLHVVYCDEKEGELTKIKNGTKTTIIRASHNRKIPNSRVFTDDILYFTEKGTNKLTLKATVKNVENHSKLSLEEIDKILDDNAFKLQLSEKEREKARKSCLCLIDFCDVEPIEPLEFVKKRIMDDWIIVSDLNEILKKEKED